MLKNNKKKAWIKGSAFSSVVLATTFLTACGGGGGGSDSGGGTKPTVEIIYPTSSDTITNESTDEFEIKISNAADCSGIFVKLNDINVEKEFTCGDGIATATISSLKGLLNEGSNNTIRASVNNSNTDEKNFSASIVSGDIIITAASQNVVTKPGEETPFNFLTRKEAWDSLTVNGASLDKYPLKYSLLTPVLNANDDTSELDDSNGDFTVTATYSDSSADSTVNLAANGRTLKTLNALQINNQAFTAMTPWLGEILAASLGEDGILLDSNNQDVCALILGQNSGKFCDLYVLSLGNYKGEENDYDWSNPEKSTFEPDVDIAFVAKDSVDEGAINLKISASFEKALVKIVFKDSADGDKVGIIKAFLSLSSGKIGMNLLGDKEAKFGESSDAPKEDFVLRFREAKKGNIDFIVAGENEDPNSSLSFSRVYDCSAESDSIFCDEGKATAVGEKVKTSLVGNISTPVKEKLEETLAKEYAVVKDGKFVRNTTLKKEISKFARIEVKTEKNFEEKSVNGSSIKQEQRTIPDRLMARDGGNESNHGVLLSFGGRSLVSTEGNYPAGKSALGSVLSSNAPDFSGGLGNDKGVKLSVTQNQLNQSFFATYQTGQITFDPIETDVDVPIIGNVKLLVNAELASLPRISLSVPNNLKLNAPYVLLKLSNKERVVNELGGLNIPPNTELAVVVIDLSALFTVGEKDNLLDVALVDGGFEYSIPSDGITLHSELEKLSIANEVKTKIMNSLVDMVPVEMPKAIDSAIKKLLPSISNQAFYFDVKDLLSSSSQTVKENIIKQLPKTYQLALSAGGIVVDNTAINISGDFTEKVGSDNSLLSVTFCSSEAADESAAKCPN